MPYLSQRSRDKLHTCHPDLIRVVNRAIILVPTRYDFTVLQGFRDKEEQNKAFSDGFSTLRWPKSKHNRDPSIAVDIAPWPIDWDNDERFAMVATYMYRAAQMEGVKIRWGGHWTRFKDLAHYELLEDD